MKETKIKWHPATESPGKKRFVGAFIKKGRNEKHMTFVPIRYFCSGILPCETRTAKDEELCVAWAYYKDFIKGITPKMIADAKLRAWGWWNEKEK